MKSSHDLNVAVVGFYGTGSSAVADLLKEYDCCFFALDRDEKGKKRPYEHKLLYTKGGLFETSCLLNNINTAYSSDIIINSFRAGMMRLYKNNFVSFGSYKKLLGNQFLDSVNAFCTEIGSKELKNGLSKSEHKKRVRFSPSMAMLQIAAKIVFKRNFYKLGKLNIMDNNKYYFAMPNKKEIQDASRHFIERYFSMCRNGKKGIFVYDQLIHPQHLKFTKYFFDDSFKVIVVRRDPRDVYCLSKYIWSKPPHGFSAPLPTDINDFCDFWAKTNAFEIDNPNSVLIINFEDLIYKYDETVKTIQDFCGLDVSQHILTKETFDPNKSIMNTQIFKRNDQMFADSLVIEQRLKQYLYDFPFEVNYKINDVFEETSEAKRK